MTTVYCSWFSGECPVMQLAWNQVLTGYNFEAESRIAGTFEAIFVTITNHKGILYSPLLITISSHQLSPSSEQDCRTGSGENFILLFNLTVHYPVHYFPPAAVPLNQINSAKILIMSFLRFIFNIISPPTRRSLKQPLPFRFSK